MHPSLRRYMTALLHTESPTRPDNGFFRLTQLTVRWKTCLKKIQISISNWTGLALRPLTLRVPADVSVSLILGSKLAASLLQHSSGFMPCLAGVFALYAPVPASVAPAGSTYVVLWVCSRRVQFPSPATFARKVCIRSRSTHTTPDPAAIFLQWPSHLQFGSHCDTPSVFYGMPPTWLAHHSALCPGDVHGKPTFWLDEKTDLKL